MSIDERERASIEETARNIGRQIGGVLPSHVKFALILSTVGDGGWATYLSNAQRDGVISLLREMADKIEQEAMTPPIRDMQ